MTEGELNYKLGVPRIAAKILEPTGALWLSLSLIWRLNHIDFGSKSPVYSKFFTNMFR
jgi:hypothetical protein